MIKFGEIVHSRSAPREPRPSPVPRFSCVFTFGLVLLSTASLTAQDGAATVPIPIVADEPASLVTPLTRDDRLDAKLERAWEDVRVNPERRREGMAALVGTAKEAGLAGLPSHSRVFAAEGLVALASGDSSKATTDIEDAIELDPRSTDARLARTLVHANGARLSTVVPAIGAMRDRLLRLSSFPFAAGNILLLVALGLVLGGILVAAAFTWSCHARIRHDVEERLKSRISPAMAVAGGWAVLVLPLILTFDLYWAALYWGFISLAYLQWRERALLSLSLLGMAVATPGVALVGQLLGVANQPYTAAAVHYLEGPGDARDRRILEGLAADNPRSREVGLLLGGMYERNGEPRQALTQYNTLLAAEESAEVLTNIGNVHYRLEEKDRALEYWNRALTVDANFAPAHYNLSQYYIEVFDFDKKNEHFGKAKEADPDLINRLVGAAPGLVDPGVDPRRLWKRWWDGSEISNPVETSLKTPPFIAALVALVAGLAMAVRRGASGTARACGKCGKPFCKACKPAKERDDMCLQCVHLFQRKDGVSPRMRSEKMKEVESFQRERKLMSMVASLVAPGSGHVLRGQGVLGWFLLTLFGLALAAVVINRHLLLEPGFVGAASAATVYWLALPVAAGLWLLANLSNLVAKAQR